MGIWNTNDSILNAAYSGNSAWVTRLDSNYYDNEQSAIGSPCFDLSNLDRPMVKLFIKSAIEDYDGAVLQSSTDEKNTWVTIGEVNSGINWFDASGLLGNPGNQIIDQNGWSGFDSTWVEGRHSLDDLIDSTRVQFRIAFGSNEVALSNSTNEGIAIDDIWIGERERLVLLEHFTCMKNTGANANWDDTLNVRVVDNPNDVVDIQYHTSLNGADAMNADNTADPSARVLYYGVVDPSYTRMDGNQYAGSALSQLDIDLRVLQDPLFDVELNTARNGDNLDIEAHITSRTIFDFSDISLQVAVVETQISESFGTYESVLKSLLPDAAGANYLKSWVPGESAYVNYTYDLNNLYEKDLYEIIAFVQNNDTKEVYQVALNDSSQSSSTVIVEEIIDQLDYDFALFPNPTKDNATLLLGDQLNGEIQITVFNQMGQVMINKQISEGTNQYLIDLSTNQSGIYYVQISSEGQSRGVKKLIVNH